MSVGAPVRASATRLRNPGWTSGKIDAPETIDGYEKRREPIRVLGADETPPTNRTAGSTTASIPARSTGPSASRAKRTPRRPGVHPGDAEQAPLGPDSKVAELPGPWAMG